MRTILYVALVLFAFAFELQGKTVSVRGHYRKNGTYVRPHVRHVRGSSSGGYVPSGRRGSTTAHIGHPVAGSDCDAVIYSPWAVAETNLPVSVTCANAPKAEQGFDICRAVYDDGDRCNCWVANGGDYCERHKDFNQANKPHKVSRTFTQNEQDHIAVTEEKLEKMRKCIDYYSDRRDGVLPSSISTLQAANPAFMAPPIKDAGGRPFSFAMNSEELDVRSAGLDGKFGNDDDIVLLMEK